jgi:hypothetical protein
MKRHLCLSILCAALAAPAFGGADIVKCVDDAGRVTLTDQPCAGGAATVRLASMPADEGVTRVQPHPMAVEHGVLPPPPQRRVLPPRVKAKPLTQDVATLKMARANFLLMDAGGKQQTLATLD